MIKIPFPLMHCRQGNLSTEELVMYINSGDYWMEEKLDGVRILLEKRADGVFIYTKNGIDITDKLPDIVLQAHTYLAGYPWLLDGELTSLKGFNELQSLVAGGSSNPDYVSFRPFDLLQAPVMQEIHNSPLRTRRQFLEQFTLGSRFVPVTQRVIKEEMLAFFQTLRDQKSEGVILKRHNDIYAAGAGSSWLRCKFLDTVTVMPLKIDDSTLMVTYGMIDPHTGNPIAQGKVKVDLDDMLTLINHMNLQSDIVPVLELTCYGFDDKLNLRHATYKGLRFDAGHLNCYSDQLQHLRKY